ncbi:hypothetical protein AAG570_009816 [Ranatra chinensis]|uniref:Uncharacterized protein n=1 Tax=Ranatra chinensis TaxID=642074 RepID=A0ABD0YSA4_9HEMI
MALNAEKNSNAPLVQSEPTVGVKSARNKLCNLECFKNTLKCKLRQLSRVGSRGQAADTFLMSSLKSDLKVLKYNNEEVKRKQHASKIVMDSMQSKLELLEKQLFGEKVESKEGKHSSKGTVQLSGKKLANMKRIIECAKCNVLRELCAEKNGEGSADSSEMLIKVLKCIVLIDREIVDMQMYHHNSQAEPHLSSSWTSYEKSQSTNYLIVKEQGDGHGDRGKHYSKTWQAKTREEPVEDASSKKFGSEKSEQAKTGLSGPGIFASNHHVDYSKAVSREAVSQKSTAESKSKDKSRSTQVELSDEQKDIKGSSTDTHKELEFSIASHSKGEALEAGSVHSTPIKQSQSEQNNLPEKGASSVERTPSIESDHQVPVLLDQPTPQTDHGSRKSSNERVSKTSSKLQDDNSKLGSSRSGEKIEEAEVLKEVSETPSDERKSRTEESQAENETPSKTDRSRPYIYSVPSLKTSVGSHKISPHESTSRVRIRENAEKRRSRRKSRPPTDADEKVQFNMGKGERKPTGSEGFRRDKKSLVEKPEGTRRWSIGRKSVAGISQRSSPRRSETAKDRQAEDETPVESEKLRTIDYSVHTNKSTVDRYKTSWQDTNERKSSGGSRLQTDSAKEKIVPDVKSGIQGVSGDKSEINTTKSWPLKQKSGAALPHRSSPRRAESAEDKKTNNETREGSQKSAQKKVSSGTQVDATSSKEDKSHFTDDEEQVDVIRTNKELKDKSTSYDSFLLNQDKGEKKEGS